MVDKNLDRPEFASLDVGPASLHLNLATITRSIGGADFYTELASLLSDLLGSDRLIVVRYTCYGAPEFIINTAMTSKAIEFYLRNLYRIDPLYKYGKTHRKGAVLNRGISRRLDADNPYYDAIQRSALICDEIAVLMPAPSQIFVGVCCEQGNRHFQEHEIKAIQTLYPMLEALHSTHLNQVLRLAISEGNRPLQGLPSTVALLDRDKRMLFRSDGWKALERDHPSLNQVSTMLDQPSGIFSLNIEKSLRWQRLSEAYGAAPNGWICVVEKRSPETLGADRNSVVAKFRERYALTPREAEITTLVMLGYPNKLIAEKLGISYGNVKNHRYRLYQKLDITTERELLSFILHSLLGRDTIAAESAN